MKYRIVTDSASNVTSLPDIEFRSVPMKVLVDDMEYVDDGTVDIPEMMTRMEHSKENHTSCPNSFEWMQAFEGADTIFAVTISSALSGSYNAAMHAKNQFMEENPGTNVFVIDSRATGSKMHMIIEKLEEFMHEGFSFEEIREKITAYTESVQLLFSLESLSNLAKNGRVNPAVAKIAGLLGIRFIGKASEEGTIHQCAIARGDKKSLNALISELLKMGYNGGKVWICHCLNGEKAEKLKNMIIENFPAAKDLINIEPSSALNSYYSERGGMIVGFETAATPL